MWIQLHAHRAAVHLRGGQRAARGSDGAGMGAARSLRRVPPHADVLPSSLGVRTHGSEKGQMVPWVNK